MTEEPKSLNRLMLAGESQQGGELHLRAAQTKAQLKLRVIPAEMKCATSQSFCNTNVLKVMNE